MLDQITQYYRDQLARIGKPKTEYAPTFQIRHTSGSTKWLNLNDESATELVKWLKDHYNVEETQRTEGQDRDNYTDDQDRENYQAN